MVLKVQLWPFLALHTEEEVWPDGTHPMQFAELSCVCIPSFRLVAPFFFLAKVPLLAFLMQKWVWPYKHT